MKQKERTSSRLVIKPIMTIDDLFEVFEDILNQGQESLLKLDFLLDKKRKSQKMSPIIKLVSPSDSKEIANLFKEVYHDTFPYKEYEDAEFISNSIRDSRQEWLMFKVEPNETVGCFGAEILIEEKKGIFHGFIIKEEYQDKLDSLKAFVGSLLYFYSKYKERVLLWSCEIRTFDSTPQYASNFFGLKPVAFFPNKDTFFNRVESEFLVNAYHEKTLKEYRIDKQPKIIRQVLNCYQYSNKRYSLGKPVVENPTINLDANILEGVKKNINKKSEKDKYGNLFVRFLVKNSDSFFKFVYNPYIRTIEKVKYKTFRLEEFSAYIEELHNFIKEHNVRYFQCFVSSYIPAHQKIFFDFGFNPIGYIPCWEFNKEDNCFEDRIIFNSFKGKIDENIQLIPETTKLLYYLKLFEEDLIKKSLSKKHLEVKTADLEKKDNINFKILNEPNDILKYLQIGTTLPILPEFYKYILHDLRYFDAKSILLEEDGNPSGHSLIFINENTLYFGHFGVINHNKDRIILLLKEIIRYAGENNLNFIEGPINVPIIIYGWGFMKEGSVDTLFIGKPVNPPIYEKVFSEKGFFVLNELVTWKRSSLLVIDPWKIKKYKFDDYEYFNPKNFDDFMKYKFAFLKTQATNLPPSSQITPKAESLVDNYAKFIFDYGYNFLVFFVRYKPSNEIVACGSYLPNPFRTDAKGNYDSCSIYTWAVDSKFQRKGLLGLMYGATSLHLEKNKVKFISGQVSINNPLSTETAKKLGGSKSRTHVLLGYIL